MFIFTFLMMCVSVGSLCASDVAVTGIDKAILTAYLRSCMTSGNSNGVTNDSFAIIAETNYFDPRMIILRTTIYDASAARGSRLTEHLLDIERHSTFHGNVLSRIAELCPGSLPTKYTRISDYTKYKHEGGLFIRLQTVFPKSMLKINLLLL